MGKRTEHDYEKQKQAVCKRDRTASVFIFIWILKSKDFYQKFRRISQRKPTPAYIIMPVFCALWRRDPEK